jgi:hypothetical protein
MRFGPPKHPWPASGSAEFEFVAPLKARSTFWGGNNYFLNDLIPDTEHNPPSAEND